MAIQIQMRRGTASAWTATNPTLAAGEVGFETDTNLFKIGTGATAWTSLPYAAVNLTSAQALTNKDLSSGTNTFPATLAPLASPTFTGTVTIPAGAVISAPKINSTYTAKTASYTFATGDEGNLFSMNNAATQQFNIPTDATFNFAIGTEFNVFWTTGVGQPTIGAVTPGTTTVVSTGATSATPKLRVALSGATAKKLAANSWIVFGDIA